MIRTTIRFEDNVFKDARKIAIDKGMVFADFVNDALKQFVQKHPKPKLQKFQFKVYKMGKIRKNLSRSKVYENI